MKDQDLKNQKARDYYQANKEKIQARRKANKSQTITIGPGKPKYSCEGTTRLFDTKEERDEFQASINRMKKIVKIVPDKPGSFGGGGGCGGSGGDGKLILKLLPGGSGPSDNTIQIEKMRQDIYLLKIYFVVTLIIIILIMLIK